MTIVRGGDKALSKGRKIKISTKWEAITDLKCQENSHEDTLIKVAQKASSEKPQFLQKTLKENFPPEPTNQKDETETAKRETVT